MRQFTSDNRSGAVPEVWAALQAAGVGHAASYGEDEWTRRAADLIRQIFETDCDVYFAATGTAANSMALATLVQSYHGVICHELAHIETDECGAPEFFSNGTKLLTAPGLHAKLTPDAVAAVATRRTDIHFPRPRAVSLTQATEMGTVYTADEVAALGETARRHGLRVHMDGSRFANAVVSTGRSPADLTWRGGVDVLCFGGTKNGMISGEAVVFFDRTLSTEFAYRCKQAGQLVSKMRFISAQWLGLLKDGTWLRNAAGANAMARRLRTVLHEATGIEPVAPTQANSVFLPLPADVLDALRARGWELYAFIGAGGVRFMCSWDTQDEEIERIGQDLRQILTEEGTRGSPRH